MSTQGRIDGGRDARGQDGSTAPRCPFCGAAWTDAMLDHYDAMVDPDGCACCGSAGVMTIEDDRHQHRKARLLPTADLCCESCGRPIFLAPGSL